MKCKQICSKSMLQAVNRIKHEKLLMVILRIRPFEVPTQYTSRLKAGLSHEKYPYSDMPMVLISDSKFLGSWPQSCCISCHVILYCFPIEISPPIDRAE